MTTTPFNAVFTLICIQRNRSKMFENSSLEKESIHQEFFANG